VKELRSAVHELKCVDPYYDDVAEERKTFEVRRADRDFRVGDILLLRQWDERGGYSGWWCQRRIRYRLDGGQFGIDPGWCVLGLEDVSPASPDVAAEQGKPCG
jgi:hypothetical protein